MVSANKSVIIVTGMSGAGKTIALQVFEDLGYFCVDGLPMMMVPRLIDLFNSREDSHRGLALGMDLRQADMVEQWQAIYNELDAMHIRPQLVFLDCRRDELVRRYATTRRPHPLESSQLGLEQALDMERVLLEPLRRQADFVLDTSSYSIHDLRRTIQEKWQEMDDLTRGLRVHVLSFGFKYGPPVDADFVFDLRFLPNPYFIEELRPLNGKDDRISSYVLKDDSSQEFVKRLCDFLDYTLPLHAEEGRYRVTIACGCTGGRHRSVAVAEYLCNFLKENLYSTTLEHRHIEFG
ncbi:MAG: RNase adapter RapZ [Desulfovibrio sp.]